MNMTIVVDTREIPSGIPKLLEQLEVPLTMAQLTHGDYWVGTFPVERKEVGDYISSLMSGHLSTQLYELSHGYEMSFLVVEGSVTEALMNSKVTRATYLSSLAGSAIKRAPDGKQGVINVLTVDTKWDTALLLKYMHEKVLSGEPRLPQMEHYNQGSEEILVYILSSFPGVGRVRAENLLKKFDGLDSLLAASIDQIAEVDNFGDKTAERFHTTLHKKVDLH